MEEKSGLSKIENIPESPFEHFDAVLAEVKRYFRRPTNAMCIASINEQKGVLNRNVELIKNDGRGFIFVTERNSRKALDFAKNPATAATLLWFYDTETERITRQIRINGRVEELSEEEIRELYRNEPLLARIRCKICKCGEEVNWDELKAKHDEVLQAYRDGRETLPQNENYTAFRIIPSDFDFYYAKEEEIADRVYYTRENDSAWAVRHVAA